MSQRSRRSQVGLVFLVAFLMGVMSMGGDAAANRHNHGQAVPQPSRLSSELANPLLAVQPVDRATAVDPNLLAANTEFSFKLFQAIQQEVGSAKAKNIFVSPSSVAIALSMAYNGSNGTTRDAMAQALQINGMSLDTLNQANADLKAALVGADPDVQLRMANSLWARQDVAFNPDFLQRNQKFYDAAVAMLDFTQPDAVGQINHWVSQNTQGKIQTIVDRLQPDDVMYLINAVYFKGKWSVPFEPSMTREQPFSFGDGSQKPHPMMTRRDRFRYYENAQFQAVNLPYGSGRWSMYVFLPHETANLTDFSKTLTAANWQTWMQGFKPQMGLVQLPQFKSAFDIELKGVLTTLGMGPAFDPQQADFSNLLSGPAVAISQVKHKTFVEVNEEGTEAAAVTGIGMVTTSIQVPSPAFELIVDRPFFCAIRDNKTGTILFMGTIQQPEV